MNRRIRALVLLLIVTAGLTACAEQRSMVTGDGARKVVLGIGNTIAESKPYIDTDEPPVEATPTPTVEPTPELSVTPEITPSVSVTPGVVKDGTFTASDCEIVIAGVKVRPGMDFTGKEDTLGKIVEKLEGVSCLDVGYDINYYYKGYNVCTFSKDGRQIVYSADFKSGDFETGKGIRIGSREEDLQTAYGMPSIYEEARRIYVSENRQMTFYISGEVVSEIMLVDTSVK